MRLRLLFFYLLVVLLSGCALLNQGYVHPVSGEKRVCRSSGWGWIGTPMAFVMQEECGDRMRAAGYEVENQ